VNQGILGNARARGGDPSRPIATRAEAYAGTDRGLVITPQTAAISRRGGGRTWFWELFHDFAMNPGGGGSFEIGTDGCFFASRVSGTGASMVNYNSPLMSSVITAGRPAVGVLDMQTGTTTSGYAGFDNNVTSTGYRMDSGDTFFEALAGIQTLSDGTDTYAFRLGFTQGSTFASNQNQLVIEYNSTLSANWQGVVQPANGTAVRYDTGVPVDVNKFYRLRIWSFGSTAVQFQVNDFSTVGASTTGIPAATGSWIGCHLVKSAGTNNRRAAIDYVYYRHDFYNERTYT